MNKIVEIFKAWGIAFNPNDSQTELAGKRMEICDGCDSQKQLLYFIVVNVDVH